MSHTLSQPEEIEIALMEQEENDTNADFPLGDKKHVNWAVQQGWHAGYVPPYRAAFMRGGN